MTEQQVNMKRFLSIVRKTPTILLFVFTFVIGYSFHGLVYDSPAVSNTDQHAVHDQHGDDAIWTCSMHPEVRLPKPGKCPKCSMDLIPEKTSATPKNKHKSKYACAMFCVPPMENPGKCPVCGMEMVVIESGGMVESNEKVPTLTLSGAAQKLAEIQVASVVRKSVSAELRMVGKVEHDETRVAQITAWVPGRIDRMYVDFTGIEVQKGDRMVDLYSPELITAQEELIQSLLAMDKLKNSQLDSLRESSITTVEAVRDKLRLWGLTPQQIEAIEKQGKPTDHITIDAPIGGVVMNKHVVEGAYVATGTKIYTIVDLSLVWVKLDAYESDVAWIRNGQEVEFHTEAYPGESFRGTVAFIDPVLDKKTRSVKVRVNVSNPDGKLKPEMFVRAVIYAAIDLDENEMPLVIPATAPLITGRRAVVYVQQPDSPGTFEGREIVLGPRAGDFYVVRSGLHEGEKVVVHGNFKIDSALQIMAKPSMMSPSGGGATSQHQHGNAKQDASLKAVASTTEHHHD